jgi:two-component SAPR family response regulator
MTPYKALILDQDSHMADELQRGHQQLVDLQIHRAATIEELAKAVTTNSPDVILFHETPNLTGIQILIELKKLKPSMPTILLCEAASTAWRATVDDRNTEVLCNPVSIQELEYRIAKLLGNISKPKEKPYETRVKVQSIPELRNQDSGRLDAKKIANAFGMSLADVSRSIGKSLQTVHRTSDSKSLQKDLFSYERIASALSRISNADNALKLWLNSPNNAFPENLPVDLIITGHAEMLADLLEDVLLGHPD